MLKSRGVDTETIRNLSNGNIDSFEKIYHTYSSAVYRRLIYLLKDRDLAEEAFQQVFIKVWENRGRLDPEKSFESFLHTIVKNLAVDTFRKIVKDKKIQTQIWTEFMSDISSGADNVQDLKLALIHEAIEKMPKQRQIIFKMCKLDGKSYKEVSEVLNISPSTISNQLVAATKFIKKYVFEHQHILKALLVFLIFQKK